MNPADTAPDSQPRATKLHGTAAGGCRGEPRGTRKCSECSVVFPQRKVGKCRGSFQTFPIRQGRATPPPPNPRLHHQGLSCCPFHFLLGPPRWSLEVPPSLQPHLPRMSAGGCPRPSLYCTKLSTAPRPGHSTQTQLAGPPWPPPTPGHFPSRIAPTMSHVPVLKCTLLSLPPCLCMCCSCAWNAPFQFLQLPVLHDASKAPLLLETP